MTRQPTAARKASQKKRSIERGRVGGQSRPARRWPEDEHDERLREALARELLGASMDGLKSFGLDARRLAKLAAQAAATTSVRPTSATRVLADAERLGNAISKWSEEPAYQDMTGRPAVLSIRGSGRYSFAKLAHEFFPRRSVADVVSLGCKNNVLERVGANKVALLSNCLLYPGNSRLLLAAAVRTVGRVFRATDCNRRISSGIPGGWPDRVVFVEVSEEDFREFVRFIRPQIAALTDISNRWLTRRSALTTKRRRQKKRVSGLQVFVYRE